MPPLLKSMSQYSAYVARLRALRRFWSLDSRSVFLAGGILMPSSPSTRELRALDSPSESLLRPPMTCAASISTGLGHGYGRELVHGEYPVYVQDDYELIVPFAHALYEVRFEPCAYPGGWLNLPGAEFYDLLDRIGQRSEDEPVALDVYLDSYYAGVQGLLRPWPSD